VSSDALPRRVPVYAYGLAILVSLLGFASFAAICLRFGLPSPLPLFLAVAICLPFAAAFGRIWSAGAWRWGLWISSGFWSFLVFAFFSFLAHGTPEWMPLIEGLVVAVVSCAAAVIAQRTALSRHVR
jgi:hypothetical protein